MNPKDIMAQAQAVPSPMPARSVSGTIFDNIIRRSLKVDPRDTAQVAKALLERFPREANLIAQERAGLPSSAAMPATQVKARFARPEVENALGDLRRALHQLTTDEELSEINAEMRGWSRAIVVASDEGLTSARFALDPRQSDRAMAARRLLGDYARVCRYAAAASRCSGDIFCRVAQCCDVVANLILIGIGDALNEAGVTRSTSLPRVPATVMQERRNMLLNALETLQQTGLIAATDDGWPRGIVTLAQIESLLDTSDAHDLRTLLDPAELARQLDELVDLASGATSDGLKQLSTVAAMTVQRFRRFVTMVNVKVRPPSPPLARFLASIQLFVQGFEGANSGYRLPFLSRSPLLVGQASVTGGIDQPTQDLLKLALARSAMAEWLDCLCCSCDEEDAQALIIFAKILYDLDRAIDLYGFGADPEGEGEAEIKAHAYGALLDGAVRGFAGGDPHLVIPKNAMSKSLDSAAAMVADALDIGEMLAPLAPDRTARAILMCDVLCLQLHEEETTQKLVSAISPICRRDLLIANGGGDTKLEELIAATRLFLADKVGLKTPPTCKVWKGVMMPDDVATGINRINFGKPGIQAWDQR